MWPISNGFREAITSPVHKMRVVMRVVDPPDRVIAEGEFHDAGCACTGDRSLHDIIIDGSVDVDVDRGARRTMNITLLNNDAEFSPNSDWSGTFYVDRLVHLFRGVVLNTGEWEVVPIGEFWIDTADVVTERNMSLVVLSGTDSWKKLNKAKFGAPLKYVEGTHLNTVIKSMSMLAGVATTSMKFDPLSARTDGTALLSKDLSFERSDIIGDALLKLAEDHGLEIYFDPAGYLTTDDLRNPAKEPSVWRFEPGQDSSLLSVKATYSDEKLYNHVIVIGTGDEDNPVYAQVQDDDPTSPTAVTHMGRRTLEYESAAISTVAQAQATAKKLLLKGLTVSEDIELQAICNPALEGNDVIEVKESNFTQIDRRYRIKSLNIPLSSSRQSIKLSRAINIDNFTL